MSNNPDRNSGPLGSADALARQAHANVLRAAQEEFAAVMRQLNQVARSDEQQAPGLPEPAEPEAQNG